MDKVSKFSALSRELRQAFGGITQAKLAALLLVSRNYISQIEAGLKTPSARLAAQMEVMLTEAANVDKVNIPLAAHEDPVPFSAAPQLREELRDQFAALLVAAGDDRNRLGWVAEQLRLHLAIPAHWHSDSGPLVPVTLPSQAQALDVQTGKPVAVASRSPRRA